MAPSFLSKLVKVASPTSRERRPSETSSPRTSEAVPRRSGSSSKSQSKSTTPTQANTLPSKDTQTSPYITVNKVPSHTSFESAGSSSTQPNVTVIPPSPLTPAGEIFENDDDDDVNAVSTLDLTTTSLTNNELPSMPTPAPTPTSTPTPTTAIPQNLTNGKANTAMASSASLAPNTLQVRKKSSTQSMKSVKKVPSELNLNVNHSKVATSPADINSGSITKTAIVDSPPDIKSPLPMSAATPDRPNGRSTVNLTVQRHNTDTASISSKSSSRPWRRSSARRPTGLASAIAASGLAMANPVLSPTHHAQISPPSIMSPQQSTSSATSKKSDSPPYMSISPAQSSTSQRTRRSVELSPKLLKPKKSINGMSTKSGNSSTQRKSSISIHSDNGSEYYAAGGDELRPEYYSGLEGSSDDDGSVSDLDSELDLGGDDIPVTGFAVASNKRNADFHDLFPTVPEGDYLIEGGWSVLHVLVLFLIFFFETRLWLCAAEGNFDPRTTLYL